MNISGKTKEKETKNNMEDGHMENDR